MNTATLKKARASPNPHKILPFSHTQDFLEALKHGKINLSCLPPLLRKIAQAILKAQKDNFVYRSENFEFALNIIPTPGIFSAPLPKNLPDFTYLPEYLDTIKCHFCGKEVVAIKITKVEPDGTVHLSLLTIECGKVRIYSLYSL